jgi:hypothetical protein
MTVGWPWVFININLLNKFEPPDACIHRGKACIYI